MKLQFVVAKDSGSHYHRLVNPFTYMKWDTGDSAEMLWINSDEYKIQCDVLVYSKYIATPVEVLREAKKEGIKIVLDLDDYWELPTNHINYQAWQRSGHTQRLIDHIKLADLVICTSMLLQDKVRELNRNTVVIPNGFPFGYENYKPMPVTHDKIVFLYAGGSTHLPDVELLRGKFKRIASDPFIKNNAEFVLAGYDTTKQKKYMSREDMANDTENFILETVRGPYDTMASIFSQTQSYRVLPTTNLDDYINFYDQADVSLIPLQMTSWNSMKSVLKIAEAGCKGIPVICSKVQPYWPELQDYPGIMWVNGGGDWIDHIRWSLKNPVGVIDMGKMLAERVRQDYDLITWNEVRKQAIKSLL